ncbi:tyrosine-type recombinase/integrase [Domibacillus sp. DTU_2020_1001157_1_SI_ALB_TIR_016]|uniref:tyrosine-type recombinase/integrase n=1 Tax=Domibacillus sp. DTU_2020_1001157_1_SI_ALB_TIR_016 TaxID=3077789 RepID=UPI003977BA47
MSIHQLLGAAYTDLNLVVCSLNSNPINPKSLLTSFYNLLEKSILSRIRFHNLTHVYASLMLQQGENIKLISERLGHSSVKIRSDTYSHILPNIQQEASNRLANKLFNG